MQNAHKFPQCQIYAPSSSFPPIYKAVVVWISRLDPFCACLAPANEKRRSNNMLLPRFFEKIVVLTAHALRINQPMVDDDIILFSGIPASIGRSPWTPRWKQLTVSCSTCCSWGRTMDASSRLFTPPSGLDRPPSWSRRSRSPALQNQF